MNLFLSYLVNSKAYSKNIPQNEITHSVYDCYLLTLIGRWAVARTKSTLNPKIHWMVTSCVNFGGQMSAIDEASFITMAGRHNHPYRHILTSIWESCILWSRVPLSIPNLTTCHPAFTKWFISVSWNCNPSAYLYTYILAHTRADAMFPLCV